MRLMRTSPSARRRFELMASEYLERMGERIRARREELGLSRSDVARQMPGKTNENAIYRWEGGKHRPHDDALEALAQVLDVPVRYFLADEPDKTVTPDLVGTLNAGGDRSQADQLDRIEQSIRDARAEREQAAAEIRRLLAEQNDLLATIRTLVEKLGIPDGITLQDHVIETVRDAAARSQRPERRTRS